VIRSFLLVLAALVPAAAAAQVAPQARLQSPIEALTQDAGEYSRLFNVTTDVALARLRAQEASVPATDAIRARFAGRFTGIAIEHQPAYRIVVTLAGDEPVPAETIRAGGLDVPVVYRTGAHATREQLLAALIRHQAEIRQAFANPPGMGVEPREGSLLVVARNPGDRAAKEAELSQLTGVPVRIRTLDEVAADMDVKGGALLFGTDPADNRRYRCTTGFVVTDGDRTGVITAAHCPDTLVYRDPAGTETSLDYLSQWGARYQDVQVHPTPAAQRPLFFADTDKRLLRELASWRNRESTRAGDLVCRRGETSGYSCSLVEIVDYSPPGDLCAGPCDPTWVAVRGPQCRGGDSGGPIFAGTVAFGIVKGGHYAADGRCSYYYYMSTDYLPQGWRLLHRGDRLARAPAAPTTPEGTR
jgi:streptogrisin C